MAPRPTRYLAIIRTAALLVLIMGGLAAVVAQQPPRQQAIVTDLDGAIGPAAARQVADAVDLARERSAEVLILRINTPGGLATSMREIITDILESPVPVIGYVAPAGSHAASAGLYVLYASHVAAMAPGTNTGSATPVQIGGLPMPIPRQPSQEDGGAEAGGPTQEASGEGDEAVERRAPMPDDPMAAKIVNDAVAFIRSIAQLRGRNADWAETAVREAASLPAEEALQAGVIDFMARDLNDLLDQLDGRLVMAGGIERQLATKGLVIERTEPSVVSNILKLLSNPNVALLLIVVGVYGLIFEFSNPGVGPGIIGAICLVLGLYALNQLPVNYAGLALMLLGIALMVAEAVTPTFGVLGLGGIVAFSIGAAILIDTDVPEYQVSWSTIIVTAALSFAVLSLLLGYVWRTFRKPVRTGAAALCGASAEVTDWTNGVGHVWVQGERWEAVGPPQLRPGDRTHVVGLKGLKLQIKKTSSDNVNEGED
ncbi:nodulation protein NfeD [Sulfitobacter sp. JBTF-M27]|uniref:Nodulation protein NfeD n=1 Tax=Sulfitobacter sediminilitoris TaxID=2698830 RepID=A0A6P0CFW2_9RHOB|nr:nodulation protein NfeD [Sulfitobacter sediminilitoris]NEK25032.1 nodulation protein NfeD [Sulfitobacter sediminilitoris]